MNIPSPLPEAALSNLLRKIALAPNNRVLHAAFQEFQKVIPADFPFDEITMTHELTSRLWLAGDRLRRVEEVPPALQTLMRRVQECLCGNLRINPVLTVHLQEMIGDAAMTRSCIDKFISVVQSCRHNITIYDLFILIGSDWGGSKGFNKEGALRDPYRTLKTFYSYINIAARLNAGSQSALWTDSGLKDETRKLLFALKLAKKGKLPIPDGDLLEFLKTQRKTFYYPIGYANVSISFLSLLAIDYSDTGYRLRLLASDNSQILAAGEKLNHYCPEVIWEGLSADQLTSPGFWKPLFEAATLNEGEQLYGEEEDSSSFLSFNSTHIIAWIIRQLGKRPSVSHVDIPEENWASIMINSFSHPNFQCKDIKIHDKGIDIKDEGLLLRQTGKEMKRTVFNHVLRKFVNLLPMDLLQTRNDKLLFKAESRLLVLVGAFVNLSGGTSQPIFRGNFLRLIEQSYGKVTAPIERLMELNPTEKQREDAKTILVSLLDIKHRFADLIRTMDRIPLSAPRPLYPSTHTVHKIDLSKVAWIPIKLTMLDSLRLNEGVQPLPLYDQWTAERFSEIHASLETWYDILVDAKSKCESPEIIMLAHRNIFSRLPIPSSDRVEDTFPDELSEGLQIGTLILLKKISSLVASEVYSDAFVPPVFVADMSRVYRFSVELYRKINSEVCKLPVSWYCLHRYLESRHSFHVPGEIKTTLESLAFSFKIISPNGHLKPSENFKEIPLFYFCWWNLPLDYTYHRLGLGPKRINPKSIDNVLTLAELADSVGLRPEMILDSTGETAKWENSFGGQFLLTVKEIAQFYTMSCFARPDAFRDSFSEKNKYYKDKLSDSLGPEDYFQIEPVTSSKFTENSNDFGGSGKYPKKVKKGETPMSQRMVSFNDKRISEPISKLPIQNVEDWRDQAELLKALPRRNAMRGTYQLHQAASGPSSLSLDVLLEYFEARPTLLLNQDYRIYFWAVLRSAHVVETSCANEPILLDRLESFILAMYKIDRKEIGQSNLNFERILWLSALTRYLCHLSPLGLKKFSPLLGKMMKFLKGFGYSQAVEARLAPHLIVCHHMLGGLSVPELARLHLLVGRNPPSDPNDAMIWLEACEAMQVHAPKIIEELKNGDEKSRRAIWGLVITSERDIQEAMQRQPQNMRLNTLAKVSSQMTRLRLKEAYLQKSIDKSKKYHWQVEVWRQSADPVVLQKVKESIKKGSSELNGCFDTLLAKTEKLLCITDTSLLLQINNRTIFIDWETGRFAGGETNLPSATLLPVHLRKHPDLISLGELLRRPLVSTKQKGRSHFKGLESVMIDVSIGAAWINIDDREYRLVSNSNLHSMNLPLVFRDGFSVWVSEEENAGILTAHAKEGIPHPVFLIDESGFIRSLKGNPKLRLAPAGYYPEAQLFSRWNLHQNDILVWLDDDNNVAELHLPLHNGEGFFTRVIRTEDGGWFLDGLDVKLEETREAVSAFAGHPVYLAAKNAQGHRLLLLPGTNPYEMHRRQEKKNYEINWNHILTTGSEEGIHQFRISPSGQIEGLVVIDNLLLMMWTLYMGQYAATAELAKRWLTPPGRPYTKDEQRILQNWIKMGYGDAPVTNEQNPSALNLRMYIIMRMARHLKNFPPKPAEGEKKSKLWSALLGPRDVSFFACCEIEEKMMHNGILGRSLRESNFEEMLSLYDHDAFVRLITDKREGRGLEYNPVSVKLYQRHNSSNEIHKKGVTFLSCHIHDRNILEITDELIWGEYTFEHILKDYPTAKQTIKVPVDRLYRKIIPTQLMPFFDKAYTLIKEGPKNPDEALEYTAIMHQLGELRGAKADELCNQYFNVLWGHYSTEVSRDNIFLWLLLEQGFLAQIRGEELPDLPSVDRRFGLKYVDSKEASEKFFTTLLDFSGMSPGLFIKTYLKEWFAKRQMRYLDQNTLTHEIPDHFAASMKNPWSSLLTSEIERWKKISEPMPLKIKKELHVKFAEWSFSVPDHLAHIPSNEKGLQSLETNLHEWIHTMTLEKTQRANHLLSLANTLPKEKDAELLEFARQIHFVSPRSVDECIGIALMDSRKRWLETCPHADPLVLQTATVEYLEVALDLAHLERIKKELKSCLNDPTDQLQIEKMVQNLTMQHQYFPETSTLPMMVSEYYSDCRMRTQPDQAQLIRTLSKESSINMKSVLQAIKGTKESKAAAPIWAQMMFGKGSVIQAIPGSGKSKKIGPIWLQMMLGTGRIPILCVPSSLFQTTLSDLQNMMWDRFRTHVRAFTFDRESCTSEKLHEIAETFHIGRLEPTVFVCSPRDLHALQLMLKERHQLIDNMRDRLKRFTITWARSCMNEAQLPLFSEDISKGDWFNAWYNCPLDARDTFYRWRTSHYKLEEELSPLIKESDLLQGILNLLQNESALLVDEAATAYDPHNLLSFPIGWQTVANPHAGVMACKIYFDWLPRYYDQLGLLDNMQSLSKPSVRNEIYNKLAETAYKEYKEYIPNLPSLKKFTAYMLSEQSGQPMKKLIDKLNSDKSMLKRQLAQELAFLKYSLTTGLEGALTSNAHVKYGRSKQDPHLHLAIPFECANVRKENTLFRQPWKTVIMTCQLYSQIWNDPFQTAELIGFLQGVNPEGKDNNILQAATVIWGRRFTDIDFSDHEGMQQLTEELDRARLHPEKAKAARLLIQTFLKACVFPSQLKLDPSQLTSTPQDIPMLANKSDAMGGTFGFEATWNPVLKRVTDHSSDASILKALAEPRNQMCHILPKGGAEAFLKYIETGALDGYMALIDTGATFKGLSNTVVAGRLLKALKGFDCILFYDEDQPGGARLSVMSGLGKTVLEHSDKEGVRRALSQLKLSSSFAFYDQARRIGTDLELKDGKALITFSDVVMQDDLLQSAMRCRGLIDRRHSIAYCIPGELEGDWDGNKVIKTAKQQQKDAEKKANFHGICEQLRGVIRAIIDRAMRSEPDFNKRHEVQKRAQNFLMEKQENDLVKTFGSLQALIKTKEALRSLRKSLIVTIREILPEAQHEAQTTLRQIFMWHYERKTSFPEFVRAGDVNEEAVQEVDLSKDQDRMRLMEEEYERMLGTRNPKKEIVWSRFDPKLIIASPIGCVSLVDEMPALYTMKEALKERGFMVPFSPNLLVSANLLSTFLGETNCLLTENQKPVHRGLFIRGEDGPKYVLISEGDARYLKEHLLTLNGRGIFMVEPSGAINQRGCREDEIVNLWKEGTDDERSLLLQALLFQGSALLLDQLPKDEVVSALQFWTKDKSNRKIAARILFEAALDLRPDDMLHYRRSQKLRALFNKTKG